ncbi:TRL-like family protein [Leptospira sp. 96542]|nr:TRL-like family protein [Leptospira sp. 96542]
MIKNVIIFCFLVLLSVSFQNCAVGPVQGGFITNNQFPGTFNPENNVKPVKEGKGCQFTILYLISFGDAGAGSIAQKNEITKVATIDHSTFGFLGMFVQSYCTIVTGE